MITIKDFTMYLKKKHNGLLLYKYEESIGGTTENIVELYILTQDLNVLKTCENLRTIKELLYGGEYRNLIEDEKEIEEYQNLNKNCMENLCSSLEFEKCQDYFFYKLIIENVEKINDKGIDLNEDIINKLKKKIADIDTERKRPKFLYQKIIVKDIFDEQHSCFTNNINFYSSSQSNTPNYTFNNIYKYNDSSIIKDFEKMKSYYNKIPLFKSISILQCWANTSNKVEVESNFSNVINISSINENNICKVKALIDICTYGRATGSLCMEYSETTENVFINDIEAVNQEILRLI